MRRMFKCPTDLRDFGKHSTMVVRVRREICSTIFSMSDSATTANDHIDGFAGSPIGELA